MKTNYEKLREELMSVDEIREDLMELRFGCEVKDNEGGYGKIIYSVSSKTGYIFNGAIYSMETKEFLSIIKIIGNPLSERHLRIYCEKKGIYHTMYESIFQFNYEKIVGVKLDNTKPFSEQTEETYKKILDFLTKN